MRLDVTNGVIAEVTDQSAGEARQVRHLRHTEALLELAYGFQGVVNRLRLDDLAVLHDAHLAIPHAQHRAAGQADDGVAPPLLTPLDRLEQVGVGASCELQVGAERRIEIGQCLSHERHAVIALSGKMFQIGCLGRHAFITAPADANTHPLGGALSGAIARAARASSSGRARRRRRSSRRCEFGRLRIRSPQRGPSTSSASWAKESITRSGPSVARSTS